MNFKSLIQCLDYFRDEQACVDYLIQQRWNGSVECAFCACTKVYKIEGGKRFKCADRNCAKKFSATVGTIFENTKVSLRIWFAAIYLCTSSKKGISSLQLSRQLAITQKTAWFVLHRIREMLKDKAPHMLKNVVEIDETFVGGKNKNRHADKKVPKSQGRSFKDKTPVLGAVERHGKVVAKVVPNTKHSTLVPTMVSLVSKDSIMVSDEWYREGCFGDYKHVILDHASEEYVRGAFHTNTIEGFWSILKRGIYGIYHQVSPKHLQRYCDEFAARYNTRDIKDNQRFELSIKNSEGRLKYTQLIGE